MLESSDSKRTQNTAVMLFSILLVIVVAVFFALDLDQIKAFITHIGRWGILVSILVYALLGLTLVPSEPLTVLTGAIFGPLVATLVAGVGNTLSAIVEYYVGRNIGQAANFMEKKEKLPFGLGKLPVNSPLFLIAARSIPGYGPKAVSVISGVYHVPLPLYIWTTAIPTFLGSAIFAYGGFGLGSLLH